MSYEEFTNNKHSKKLIMYKQVETMPSAYITVNNGRKKIKQDKYVYLNNGQEFQIELFNPTSDNLLTKIWINNNLMSRSGIILRPGERVFLERYIDTPKKFLFDTYDVGGDSESVKKAIEKNGLIKVQFFKEDTTPEYTDTLLNGGLTWTTPDVFTYTTQNINGGIFGSSTNTLGFFDTTSVSTLTTTSIVGQDVKSTPKKKSKKTETGRIEQGSHSEQSFTTVSKKFLMYAFRTVEYHIKPTSQQIVDTRELTKYCVGCGKKAKPSNKFCSNCGTKL